MKKYILNIILFIALCLPVFCIAGQHISWSELVQDCMQAAEKIQNHVERNKFTQLMDKLRNTTNDVQVLPTSSNPFLKQNYQTQWEAVNAKLKSRLASAQQNLPEGSDKALIINMLSSLLNEAAAKLPKQDNAPSNGTAIPSLTPAERDRELYLHNWLHSQLPILKKQLGDFSPTVFISYAWGPTEKAFVSQFAEHLKEAGINVRLDTEHNGLSTTIHTGFVTELDNVDYVLVIGSKLYADKVKIGKNNVVTAEARIIAERNKRQPGRILPILLSGNPKESFPAFMRDKVFVNFTDPKLYAQELSKVILAVCKYANNRDEIIQTLKNIEAGAVKNHMAKGSQNDRA